MVCSGCFQEKIVYVIYVRCAYSLELGVHLFFCFFNLTLIFFFFFFFQAEDGIRDLYVTVVQTCALPILPPEKRNFIFRGFNHVYDPMERGYSTFIGRMVRHSGLMVVLALAIAGVSLWGLVRIPTAFKIGRASCRERV